MIAARSIKQRPRDFALDYSHPLAKGLVFAGLGRLTGSLRYVDSSNRANHGTLTNMDPPTDWVWVPQLGRWALDFDGSNDYVSLPILSLNQFTLSAWVLSRRNSNWAPAILHVADGNGGWILLAGDTSATSKWQLCKATNYYHSHATSDTVMTLNAWTSVIGTCSSSGALTLWINGVLQATQATNSNLISGAAGIGFLASLSDRMNGIVSDILVHNRALSAPEIRQLADPANVMLSGMLRPLPHRMFRTVVAGGTEFTDAVSAEADSAIYSADLMAALDAMTAQADAAIAASDLMAALDAQTVSASATSSGSDVFAGIDSQTTSGSGSISMTDILGAIDVSAVYSDGLASASDVAAMVDSTSANASSTVSASDTMVGLDAATVEANAEVSSADLLAAVDTGTAEATFVVTLDDVFNSAASYVDALSTSADAEVFLSDVLAGIDTATVTATATVTLADIGGFIDAGSATADAAISISDVYHAAGSGSSLPAITFYLLNLE